MFKPGDKVRLSESGLKTWVNNKTSLWKKNTGRVRETDDMFVSVDWDTGMWYRHLPESLALIHRTTEEVNSFKEDV